jgi:hypothetical protein
VVALVCFAGDAFRVAPSVSGVTIGVTIGVATGGAAGGFATDPTSAPIDGT